MQSIMSVCGETINFYATSLGRNNFLQVATGLFGGAGYILVDYIS